MNQTSRRIFMQQTLGAGAALALAETAALAARKPGSKMKLGLVTYLWAQDWDLPTLIANCEESKILGVELRTEHKHGVQPEIDAKQRAEVKKRFADSPVTFLGPGTNECYDSSDPAKLKENIERTKAWIKLSQDTGGTGVKVKPNSFQKGVSEEQTIEQIGKSLNIVGAFAADHGQQIRLEVHGSCCRLPTIKAIMDIADCPAATVCWNCNEQDLLDKGIEDNFNLVKKRFGDTAHIRELNLGDYPYQQLMDLFVAMNYGGWILLEGREIPKDRIAGLIEQLQVFKEMIGKAQAKID